jgi:hypothetical protein
MTAEKKHSRALIEAHAAMAMASWDSAPVIGLARSLTSSPRPHATR